MERLTGIISRLNERVGKAIANNTLEAIFILFAVVIDLVVIACKYKVSEHDEVLAKSHTAVCGNSILFHLENCSVVKNYKAIRFINGNIFKGGSIGIEKGTRVWKSGDCDPIVNVYAYKYKNVVCNDKILANVTAYKGYSGTTYVGNNNKVWELSSCDPVIKILANRKVACNGRVFDNATAYKVRNGGLYFDVGKGKLLTSSDCNLITKIGGAI